MSKAHHACYFNVLWDYCNDVLFDTDKHHLPHIHLKYGQFTCVISITDSEVLQGDLPKNKLKLVWDWIELHRDELMANWELAINGKQLFDIKPLQ